LKERRRGCVGGEGEGEEGQIKQDRTGNPEKVLISGFSPLVLVVAGGVEGDCA
jgi:hypothetical protein